MRLCIGVQLHSEPHRLSATLRAIAQNTRAEVEIILLPDGPDPATRSLLGELRAFRQLGTPRPLGAPACFNRLVSASNADVLVFLESGAVVGPGWLEHLLAALEADPGNGLAGPSTNLAWNEQCAFPGGGGTDEEVGRTAAEAVSCFGTAFRTLEPLFSLSDFCYLVRREVIHTIGLADERYGQGPCWEMDYNIRAARAGFRGVWACAAYVYRAPFTERRRIAELRRLEASKRLYQDKFCGLRLAGGKGLYEAHCVGDACEHFAPPSLIQTRLAAPTLPYEVLTAASLARSESSSGARSSSSTRLRHTPIGPQPAAAPERRRWQSPYSNWHKTNLPSISLGPDTLSSGLEEPIPLVSCIMPTADRRELVPQAIRYFLRQDYPRRELLIVDDGNDAIGDLVPADPRIRYIRLARRETVGTKRNLACREARGALIAHWDDDDWMADHRLSYQISALLREKAELCGLDRLLFLEPASGQAWRYVYPENARPWLAGATLCYTKALWKRRRFPDIDVGEDNRFVWGCASRDMVALDDESFYVAIVHPGNTSPKQTSDLRWHPIPSDGVRRLLGNELTFYEQTWTGHLASRGQEHTGITTTTALRTVTGSRVRRHGDLQKVVRSAHSASPAGIAQSPVLPLVSCIMPTYNRRRFISQAIDYFFRQRYSNKELIIVDDGTDRVEDLVPQDPRIRYQYLEKRETIGKKRNLAVEQARGEFIAHWDDDDWYADDRLTYQLTPLVEGRADVSALTPGLMYELATDIFWSCDPKIQARMFYRGLHCGTLAYARRLWGNMGRYPEVSLAEDAAFLRQVSSKARVLTLSGAQAFIYLRHGSNAWRFPCGRYIDPRRWTRSSPPPWLASKDLQFYQAEGASEPLSGIRRGN